MSCSTPEIESNTGYKQTTECGTVIEVEYTPDGAYIYIQTESGNVKYKVNGNRFKIGSGGATFLDFETFNGNVYLKEKTN